MTTHTTHPSYSQAGDGRRTNRLTLAAKRGGLRQKPFWVGATKTRVGDARIVSGGAIQPMRSLAVKPMISPMVNPMRRRMGETTIEARRSNRTAWAGTPFAARVGDVDLSPYLEGWDGIGWEWRNRTLTAYLHRGEETFRVTVPVAKIRKVLNRAACELCGSDVKIVRDESATVGDIFSDIGNFFTQEIPNAVDAVGRGISSFFNDPGAWFENAAKDLAGMVADIGQIASDVVSHPIFAGVMSAIAVIPPLQAVGAAGLAAYAGVNAAKPAIDAGIGALRAVDQGIQGDWEGAGKQLAAGAGKALGLTSEDVNRVLDETVNALGIPPELKGEIPGFLLFRPDGTPYPASMPMEERKIAVEQTLQTAKDEALAEEERRKAAKEHAKRKERGVRRSASHKASIAKAGRQNAASAAKYGEWVRKQAQKKKREEQNKRWKMKAAEREIRKTAAHKESIAKAGRQNKASAAKYGAWVAEQARKKASLSGPLTGVSQRKAQEIVRNIKENLPKMPPKERMLLTAAFQSIPDAPSKGLGKPRFGRRLGQIVKR